MSTSTSVRRGRGCPSPSPSPSPSPRPSPSYEADKNGALFPTKVDAYMTCMYMQSKKYPCPLSFIFLPDRLDSYRSLSVTAFLHSLRAFLAGLMRLGLRLPRSEL